MCILNKNNKRNYQSFIPAFPLFQHLVLILERLRINMNLISSMVIVAKANLGRQWPQHFFGDFGWKGIEFLRNERKIV